MRISLNLLPEEYKAHMRRQWRARAIARAGIRGAIVPIVLMGALTGLLWVAHTEKDDGTRLLAHMTQQEAYKKIIDGDATIHKIHQSVTHQQKLLAQQKDLATIMYAIMRAVPAQVALRDVSLLQDGTVSITGIAASRDLVIAFADALQHNTCFDQINTPLTSLVQREDPRFTITAIVVEECL